MPVVGAELQQPGQDMLIDRVAAEVVVALGRPQPGQQLRRAEDPADP